MGVCPPPGSHVGMAHVLMSLLPYIIPPCGRATCRGTCMMIPPRGTYWDGYVGHMVMQKASWCMIPPIVSWFGENFPENCEASDEA